MTRCEECKAWHFTKDVSGFCKRNAPQPTVMREHKKTNGAQSAAVYILVWPSTLKDDGCEESIPRVEKGKESDESKEG